MMWSFVIVAIILLLTGLALLFVRKWYEVSGLLDIDMLALLDPRECVLSACNQPGYAQRSANGNVIFICRAHLFMVSAFIGPQENL